MAQALAVSQQLGVLVPARSERLDLVDFEGEQVQVAIACSGPSAQLVDLGGCSEHLGVADSEIGAGHGGTLATEAVEELELRRRDRELAVLVLAVERDQAGAQLAEVGRGGGAALHECAGAAVGAD